MAKTQEVDIIVLGAGIIGVSTAYHLQQKGKKIVLIDRQNAGLGTSYGNAGLIERSSVIPYSFPRQWGEIFRYATNRQSAMRYDLSYLPKIAPWLFQFWRQSAPKNLEQSTKALLPLIEHSVSEHDKIIEAVGAQKFRREQGWIEIYRTEQDFRAAQAALQLIKPFHLHYDILQGDALYQRESGLKGALIGGIHWLDPKTVTNPGGLTQAYCDNIIAKGGLFAHGDANSLQKSGDLWSVASDKGDFQARDIVVALGWESTKLLAKLGIKNIPLAVKRGYHLHFQPLDEGRLHHSLCDSKAGFVLAPMDQGIRLTTGIEFAKPDAPANEIQMQRAIKIAQNYFAFGPRIEKDIWLGQRPCLPDMCPVLGGVDNHPGLWLHFGHAHHGLTLGPASGRLLAELINGETPFAPVAPFSVHRFIK